MVNRPQGIGLSYSGSLVFYGWEGTQKRIGEEKNEENV